MITPDTHEQQRTPELIVAELVVIDFDRTLGDVDASMTRLYIVASQIGVDTEAIKLARTQKENDGGSFDPYSFIQAALGDRIDEFDKRFIALDGPAILYDDVKPFLAKLDLNRIPYHVLTYGENERWQRLKIQASGLTGTVQVIDHQLKGIEIAAWKNGEDYQHDQNMDVAQKTKAKTVCLLDDKRSAFTGLPEECIGFCIQRTDELLESQKGEVPPNVDMIKSLDELETYGFIVVKKQ